jgi:methionyl-tRNA synthetase
MKEREIFTRANTGMVLCPDETFWNKEDLKEGNLCPECGREVKWVSEEKLLLQAFEIQPGAHRSFQRKSEFVQPDFRRNEMMRILEAGLKDLSITRTSFNGEFPCPKILSS